MFEYFSDFITIFQRDHYEHDWIHVSDGYGQEESGFCFLLVFFDLICFSLVALCMARKHYRPWDHWIAALVLLFLLVV